ncbi:MAG TPA: fibronectin type III domain-containing protein, partial [Armatimonadota bacterium]|nr:fibronectin type III domain-containing protein [Armatimonadota bacterium]
MQRLLVLGFLSLLLCSAGNTLGELCLSDNADTSQNLPVGLSVQPAAAAALFDGSYSDNHSLSMSDKQTMTVHFAEPIRLARAQVVYSYNNASIPPGKRHAQLLGYAHFIGTCSATRVTEFAKTALDSGVDCRWGRDGILASAGDSAVSLPWTQAVDTITINILPTAEAAQARVCEIYLWGMPERLMDAPATPINFTASEATYSAINLRWDALPAPTAYVRVRYRAQGTTAWAEQCFTTAPALLHWLRPNTTYEITADAMGVSAAGTPIVHRVALPHPLAVRRMGDLWGMNYFPSGGGAHQPLPDEPNTMRSMVTLMHAAGVRHVRWWWQSPSGAEMFAAAGMSLLPNILTYDATYATSAYYDQLAQRTGSWLVGEHNEPDLGPTSAEAFTKSRIPACKASRQYAASMQLCGPALGGELLGPGGDYLEQCYDAGLKDAL